MKIQFSKPFFTKAEINSVMNAMKSKNIGGDGPIGRKSKVLMQDLFGIKCVLLTTSCTHALEMALMALKIKEGDEVLLPSFSFVSAANAIVRLKAIPIFVDIDDDSLNIDPIQIQKAVSKKTKAVICVHYAGVGCDMTKIMKIAQNYRLYVIEDAAQALGSTYKGRYLGSIGDIGCYSFHETKNITCGEGGAFLTNSDDIAKKAEIIREKGTDRSAFLRGEIDKYTWRDIGSSYIISDLLAAVLFEQLHKMEYIIKKRRQIGLKYEEGLKKLEENGAIMLPNFPKKGFNWHLFYFRVKDQKTRDCALKKLRQKGIEATFHFVPLHLSPYVKKKYGYRTGDLPVTEKASKTLIRLPIYPELTYQEQKYIINCINKIFK
ncbi:dTDP-4-amino-4,6-dideoxygalactose transaminase [Candidatus Omnitrophota bacterium]